MSGLESSDPKRLLGKLVQLVDHGKGSLETTTVHHAQRLISELKLACVRQQLPSKTDQRTFHETCIRLSIKIRDWLMFERHMAQLTPLYEPGVCPEPSAHRDAIIGLHLMRLLAQNRLAEFHMELELLPFQERDRNPYVQFPVEVEQALVEGHYRRMLRWDSAEEWIPFLELLRETTISEWLTCCASAYDHLTVDELCEMMGLNRTDLEPLLCSVVDTSAYRMDGDRVWFDAKHLRRKDESKDEVLGEQLQRTLNYMRALDRIV